MRKPDGNILLCADGLWNEIILGEPQADFLNLDVRDRD